jgi:uncharacterized protein YcbX
MYLSGLYVYPIKSAGGIPIEAWDVDGRGLRHDRRWMLVDGAGGSCRSAGFRAWP